MSQGNRHSPFRGGFTLVELLVSITILVLIVSVVSGAFLSVTSTMDLARTGAERLRYRQLLYRIVTENLSAVYADAATQRSDFQFLGEDESGAFGDADRLSFCTSMSMPGARALPGILRKVTFEVVNEREAAALGDTGSGALAVDAAAYEENAEALQGQTLVITMSPLNTTESFLDKDSGASKSNADRASEDVPADRVYIRKIPVRSVNFTYCRGEDLEDEWDDTWDSNEEGRMPWAVKVSVNFARTEEEYQEDIASGISFDEEADFEMVVPIPLGAAALNPMADLNHFRPFEVEKGDGTFDLNTS
ncbi:MAG: prepilin-type N-terminal cleavage/methylation domain-containing protein [Candidatus Hydrogenedentes bacterium]|nr:prepilin-type N-terminal cleavage/methylation domain-containing protein [Candidatus Hydrogenedentota bacterium]